MLHSAIERLVRKVVDEQVRTKGTVIHPLDLSTRNAPDMGYQLLHIVVGTIGVYDDSEMPATLVKIGFGKTPQLHRRVDQLVVVGCRIARRGCRSTVIQRGHHSPIGRHSAKAQFY